MGKCVDKYCLIEELKHMEHCQIYIGQERTTKQEVFVKVFSLKFIERNKTLHQKVLNEMTIIESNDFPFIVKAVSYLKTANNMYHVYDYFAEKSLRELIAEGGGGLSIDEACRKARRILECVLALHSNNIIHRNLKPSALLVKGRDLYLTNFLNAIQLENPEMQNDEVYGGSLVYRAPEAISSPQFTKKSDIYSIGVILYEMIFGVPPHSEGQIVASNGSFPNLEFKGHIRQTKLPPMVEELIRRLMTKNPMQRFSGAEAITFIDSKILNSSIQIETPPAVSETPEKYLVNLFKRFQRKMSFMNELGDLLNDEFLELECGVYLAYVVLKKLYLLTKTFKQFINFDSLKEVTSFAQKIIWSKEYQEIEDFVIRIEREALSQLVTYQNVLLKNFNSKTHKELAKDLETLDDFKIWDVVVKAVIEPFFEQVRNFSPDSRVLPKVALFMKNVEANTLLNCQSDLISL